MNQITLILKVMLDNVIIRYVFVMNICACIGRRGGVEGFCYLIMVDKIYS